MPRFYASCCICGRSRYLDDKYISLIVTLDLVADLNGGFL